MGGVTLDEQQQHAPFARDQVKYMVIDAVSKL